MTPTHLPLPVLSIFVHLFARIHLRWLSSLEIDIGIAFGLQDNVTGTGYGERMLNIYPFTVEICAPPS